MAESESGDRLQPSLLDRLTDDAPHNREEPRDRRVLSSSRLRDTVLRDLSWLFNTTGLSASLDLDDSPEVASSVLNFGLPDLAGHTVSNVDVETLERVLRQVILDYEPRLLRRTVKVRLAEQDRDLTHNQMVFHIEAQLWSQPLPIQLYLKTEVDLENGDVSVIEQTGGGDG